MIFFVPPRSPPLSNYSQRRRAARRRWESRPKVQSSGTDCVDESEDDCETGPAAATHPADDGDAEGPTPDNSDGEEEEEEEWADEVMGSHPEDDDDCCGEPDECGGCAVAAPYPCDCDEDCDCGY